MPNELHRYRRAPEAVLRPRVASWVDQPNAQGSRAYALDRDDLAQIRKLAAAVLHDVAGLSQRQVMEWTELPTHTKTEKRRAHERRLALMSGGSAEVNGDTKVTRERIRQGRKLWIRVAAWPWWAVMDAGESLVGGMPPRWWEIRRVVETHQTWRLLRPDGSAVAGGSL